jgi:cell division septal protein FtsQ
VAVLALGSAVWLTFFSTLGKIKEVSINGLDRMSDGEIRQLLSESLSAKRLLFLPQDKLFLFDEKRFLKTFEDRYSFQRIAITKKWPDKLEISITEKISACVWNEADKYYYADAEGFILSETNPLDLKDKRYPLIANESDLRISDGKINADTSYIGYASELMEKMAAELPDIGIDRFIVDKDIDTLKILTPEGIRISFNTKTAIDDQLEKLAVVKREKLKDDFKDKKYIDLRFGDKIYYQ